MKRKMYRIELVNDFTYLTQTLVLMAARSNGGKHKPLSELKTVAEVLQLAHPDHIVEPIGDNILHIDCRKGANTITVLRLTEIEVCDFDMPQITAQEARDLLDEIAPTLNRQGGIANENNFENLN